MESLIHIAHKEVYTKVIHANMMIPQIETRVRIQVALEFFFFFTLRHGNRIVVPNNESQLYWGPKTIHVGCKHLFRSAVNKFAPLLAKAFHRESLNSVPQNVASSQ